MKKIFILLLLAVFTECSSYKLIAPTQIDADRGNEKFKFEGNTLTDLKEGRQLYEQKCVKCHDLKKPFTKSEATVTKVMPLMAKKANLDNRVQGLI
ncbi:MAG TPA: hypothetical protein VK590_02145, partial [Saprospiraceae bacterium]|nr:hypothetical protein [Saprospiraceae bacterium]